MNTFLDKIAFEITNKFGSNIANVIVVLPNKRSKIFLIEALKKRLNKTFFAPEIFSIEELIEQISDIRILNAIELLFEFYKVYERVSPKEEKQNFEQFAPWAKILLRDFSDIDAYLVEQEKVLRYLKDIKEMEHWSLSEQKTKLIEKHLRFWSMLPLYYQEFQEELLKKNQAYQGLAYKNSIKKLEEYTQKNQHKVFVFAGFNALTTSEERIIKHFLSHTNTQIYWDADKTFLEDNYHQAGRFLRKIKQKWSYYATQNFNWSFDEFSNPKEIKVIGTPKAVGQARIIGDIVENLLHIPQNLSKTVIILPEKNLLTAVLYSLPASITDLNITLGYPSKNNPVQFLINRLFKMHSFVKNKSGNNYTFYYKDVLEVLSHPIVEPLIDAQEVVNIIKSNNFTFITYEKLIELQTDKNTLFHLIFDKWTDNTLEILGQISNLLLYIKNSLNDREGADKITKAYLYEIYTVINQLKNHFSQIEKPLSLNALYGIYKQMVDTKEVAFEGEPLSGLQIMGILESRNLDFENVIIASMNEGKFPLGKSHNSFIPMDIKREYGLPSYKERDAVYAYHFYRLLQRAKNVFLIYNTDNDSLDGGEKSRFITQLEVEKQPNHALTHQIYQAEIPATSSHEIIIEKSESVMQRLREIALKGFSPSALSAYIRNPLDFYYQRILLISEIEEVEETIESNTLGNIIHKTLETLYTPFLNHYLSEKDIDTMETQVEDSLSKNFKLEFKEGEIKKGKNLLAFEAAKRSVLNFLRLEKHRLTEGDTVKILYLEKSFEKILETEQLPYPVKIAGFIDRVEIRNNRLRILDYKTGKVEAKNLSLSNWNDFLTEESKNKIIQLLCYAYMFEEQTDLAIEVGIISFKNLKSGFLPFQFTMETKEEITTFSPEIKEMFIIETTRLLTEILDQEIPFRQKTI